MKNEKITVITQNKKSVNLTALLCLPLKLHERARIICGSQSLSTSPVTQILEVSLDGVVFETENTRYHLTYARRPAEIEVMCA